VLIVAGTVGVLLLLDQIHPEYFEIKIDKKLVDVSNINRTIFPHSVQLNSTEEKMVQKLIKYYNADGIMNSYNVIGKIYQNYEKIGITNATNDWRTYMWSMDQNNYTSQFYGDVRATIIAEMMHNIKESCVKVNKCSESMIP